MARSNASKQVSSEPAMGRQRWFETRETISAASRDWQGPISYDPVGTAPGNTERFDNGLGRGCRLPRAYLTLLAASTTSCA